jgi:hypothetical protein
VLVLLSKCVAISQAQGTFVLYTLVFMMPLAKKSDGVKSGEHGAQYFGAAVPIHVFQKTLLW